MPVIGPSGPRISVFEKYRGELIGPSQSTTFDKEFWRI